MNEKLEQRAFDITGIEVRAGEGDEPIKITGYFIEWEKLSNPIMGFFREKFAKGAFRNLVNGDIRALWQHDVSKVLGRTTNKTLTIYEDDRGAKFELIPPETTWGKDAVESIRRGDVSEMSFMFKGFKDEWDEKADPDYPIRTVLEADLYEVSPVTFAAYPQTSVGVRSAQDVYQAYVQKTKAKKPDSKIAIRKKKLDLLEKSI
ncbi:HK97 family phage prohead protease [Tepidibacillus decaturensis]|uniref:Prohead serine protease domain-containing protein n=1 Tax=Tepidibacillus decaturensis TaxID=1413211 RepID=A0A135L1I8_9BACI|nr:HK97 family phage prohead protease [Tepidibacillus decaturensis]KXG42871.1 hypothetical protein U473_01620 [Tepidibacillus decaturensis]